MKLNKLTPFGIQVKQKLLEMRMTNSEFCDKYEIPMNRFSEILYGARKGEKYRSKITKILNIEEAA